MSIIGQDFLRMEAQLCLLPTPLSPLFFAGLRSTLYNLFEQMLLSAFKACLILHFDVPLSLRQDQLCC